MSFWMTKKEPDGKYHTWLVDIPFELVMFFFGFVAIIVVPRYIANPSKIISDGCILVALGFTSFLVAKGSIFRRGIWVSFGYKQMSRPMKYLYMFGYIVMGIGLLLFLIGLRRSV